MSSRLAAEFIGTFWLVFGGCGAAIYAANPAGDGSVGIGFLGVSLAFGLTVLTGVYAFGAISGGHFNPAVTIMTLWNRGIATDSAVAYIVVQVAAGIAAVTTYNYLKKRGLF
jgi:aquaporin Z